MNEAYRTRKEACEASKSARGGSWGVDKGTGCAEAGITQGVAKLCMGLRLPANPTELEEISVITTRNVLTQSTYVSNATTWHKMRVIRVKGMGKGEEVKVQV